ncbi:MAG: amidohydrolase [Candidatus Hydrogenedentes bacterium]|nr:amidohydrolase [Candidatus Hydrogenedentota bacterium]
MDEIRHTITRTVPEIMALRRELHEHPEIRFEEQWTSDRVAQFLDEARIPHQRGYAKGTGIVATIRGEGHKTVLLRADMDALEIREETGLPYASRIPDRMHACGHDGHTACLCGVAKALAEHQDLLKGAVKLVFQPAEEQAAGGRFMVEEGVLDDVDAAFALHAWPTLPAGKIGIRPGWMMAGADWFRIKVRGVGCHGADPAAGVDPILVSAHITTALQSIVSREIDPWEAGVVTVARIQAGMATNIIPETALLEGTYRSLRPEIHAKLAEAIQRVAEHTARAHRASATVGFGERRYPALYNDPAMAALVAETGREVLGADNVVEIEQPCMASEDFAFYLQKVPGTLICLGIAPPAGAPSPPLHSPRFNFNDDAIPTAMRLLCGLVERVLGQP